MFPVTVWSTHAAWLTWQYALSPSDIVMFQEANFLGSFLCLSSSHRRPLPVSGRYDACIMPQTTDVSSASGKSKAETHCCSLTYLVPESFADHTRVKTESPLGRMFGKLDNEEQGKLHKSKRGKKSKEQNAKNNSQHSS